VIQRAGPLELIGRDRVQHQCHPALEHAPWHGREGNLGVIRASLLQRNLTYRKPSVDSVVYPGSVEGFMKRFAEFAVSRELVETRGAIRL
jgi:hypothetical protein